MPLYEYKCQDCGKVFEIIQKFADAPLTTHADCGGTVQRLISAPAFHLKGSGWYATDYGKGNAGTKSSESKSEKSEAKSTAKTDSGSSSSDSKTTETKSTESKPAASESKSTSSSTTSDSKQS